MAPQFVTAQNNLGAVFKLTKIRQYLDVHSLHDFTGGNDGKYPMSNVTIDTSGNLYGTAFAGGPQNLDGNSGIGILP
jgi:hypothetical protein